MVTKQNPKSISQGAIDDARSAALKASFNIYRRLSLHRGSLNFQNYPSSATIKSSSIVIGEYKDVPDFHPDNDLEDYEARWDTESISLCEPSVLSALTIDTTQPTGHLEHTTSNATRRKESSNQSERKKIYRAIKNTSLDNMVKLRKACRDIWMCCFCGITFISEETASAHEVICVKNAFCNRFGSYHSSANTTDITRFQYNNPPNGQIELPFEIKVKMVMTDEALHKTAKIGKRYILTFNERESLKALHFKFRDRLYYDIMADLTCSKQIASNKDMSILVTKQGFMSKIQSRLANAYELIKEGNTTEHGNADHYERKVYKGDTIHNDSTLYVNIIVKQSIKFVTNELERIATERWKLIERNENKEFKNQFERIRKMAHIRALQIAKLALQADAKPEKVAIQLSNDLFR